MKAPNFTRENAAEMARRATAARMQRLEREQREREEAQRALASMPVSDDARRECTLKQLDAVDRLMSAALDDDDSEQFLKLVAAKERLWKLVHPTGGVTKALKTRRAAPVLPIA
jgi:hypothetical protein